MSSKLDLDEYEKSRVSHEGFLDVEDELIVLMAPYDLTLVSECRQIAGRGWDSVRKVNTFPLEAAPFVWDIAAKWRIDMSDEVKELPDLRPAPEPEMWVDDTRVKIKVKFDRALIDDLKKTVPGAVFSSVGKCWSTPTVNIFQAVDFARRHSLIIEPGVVEHFTAERQLADELHEASKAVDADIDIPSAIPLLPYQRAGVAYMLKTRRAMLADVPGAGKTPQALAAAVVGDCLPAVVVCPNTLKLNWELEVQKFFPDLTVTILEGRSSQPVPYADIIVVNYDIVDDRAADILYRNPRALICDESHAIKNGRAKYQCPKCNTKCRVNSKRCTDHHGCGAFFDKPEEIWTVKRCRGVMKLARSIPEDGMAFMLSGTPITNRPSELIPQLIAIGRIEDFGGRWKFQNRYAPGGSGATNLPELNRLLRERCFIRRVQADFMDEVPELRNALQYVPVDGVKMKEYRQIEADVVEYLAQRARELALEAGEDEMSAYWEKKMRAEAAEHLVRISVLKNAVVDLKFDTQLSWIEDFLENNDEKVIVFAEHISVVERVAERFGDACVKIRGGVSGEDRAAAVKRFQEDGTCRVFVGNMEAAGTGLTLTASSNVIFLEQAWTPSTHSQCISRAYARANDNHACTAWWLLAKNTIDDDIFKLLQEKDKVVTAATDGTDVTAGGSVLGDLIISLANRGLHDG